MPVSDDPTVMIPAAAALILFLIGCRLADVAKARREFRAPMVIEWPGEPEVYDQDADR